MDIVAKNELERLTQIQSEEYHAINDTHTTLKSEFLNKIQVCSWYSSNDVLVEKIPINKSNTEVTIKYSITPSQSYLTKAQLRILFPPCSVKKKYADKIVISLPHNAGIAPIKNGELLISDFPSGNLPNYCQNAYHQYNRNPNAGSDRNFNLSIGNVTFMEEWNTKLPSYPCNINQPFGLLEEKHKNLPIFLCYKESAMNFEVYFKYTFELSLSKLIRMGKRMPDGSIKSIKFNRKYFNGPKMIDVPNMYIRYCRISNNEVNFIKEVKLDNKGEIKQKIRKFFRDFEYDSYDDGIDYGKEYSMPIESKSPGLAIMYSGEDKVAKESFNSHGNYTNDYMYVYQGFNVIRKSSLYYGTIAKFKDFEPDQIELAQARDYMKTCPMDNGYNVYALCNDPFGEDVSPGVVMMNKDTTLTVKIGNTDPRLNTDYNEDKEEKEDEEDEESEDEEDEEEEKIEDKEKDEDLVKIKTKKQNKRQYILHVAILNLRQMEIRKSETDDKVFKFLVK